MPDSNCCGNRTNEFEVINQEVQKDQVHKPTFMAWFKKQIDGNTNMPTQESLTSYERYTKTTSGDKKSKYTMPTAESSSRNLPAVKIS